MVRMSGSSSRDTASTSSGRGAAPRDLARQAAPRALDQLGASATTRRPQRAIIEPFDDGAQLLGRPPPAIAPARRGPELVGPARIPGRNVDAVGHVIDGNLSFWPARKHRLEEPAADLAVQSADAVDVPRATDRETGRPEWLGVVAGNDPTKPKQPLKADAQLGQITAPVRKILREQLRGKGIESCRHRGVRREHGARARRPERGREGQSQGLHRAARALEDRQRGVSLVEMTGPHLKTERVEQPPPADPEHDLLAQPGFGGGVVELAGDAPVDRIVHGHIAVEQVERRPAHCRTPRPQPEGASRQVDGDPQPVAPTGERGLDRQRRRIVVGIKLVLSPFRIQHLTEVALLIEQTDSHERHAEIARRLQVISGEHTKPARVERQRLADSELHAEVRGERRWRLGTALVAFTVVEDRRQELLEGAVGRQCLETLARDILKDDPGIARLLPGGGIERAPQTIGRVIPGPAQIER